MRISSPDHKTEITLGNAEGIGNMGAVLLFYCIQMELLCAFVMIFIDNMIPNLAAELHPLCTLGSLLQTRNQSSLLQTRYADQAVKPLIIQLSSVIHPLIIVQLRPKAPTLTPNLLTRKREKERKKETERKITW